MKSKAFKGIVLTTFLAATMLLLLSTVQVPVKAAPDGGVEINEFTVNDTATAAGIEWVEIINTGAGSVNVSGWYLKNITLVTIGTIPDPYPLLGPKEVYVFDPLPAKSLEDIPLYSTNTGQILLYDKTGVLVDNKTFTYSEAYAGQSSHQIYDGLYDIWECCLVMSKGYTNCNSTSGLKISEVLAYHNSTGPTPVKKEFIEIYNTGGSAISLTGWKLRSRYYSPVYSMMGSIGPGAHLVYTQSTNQTWSMHNSYGTVAICNPNGQEVDRLTYGHFYMYGDDGTQQVYFPYETNWAAPIAHSYERYPVWRDTDRDNVDFRDQASPNPCSIALDTTPPVANAGPDQTRALGIVVFDGSASSDDVGIVSYVWTFTDVTPQTLTGVHPTYTFTNTGAFVVTLNVTDASGNWDTDDVTITVGGVGGAITPIDKLLMIMPWIGLASAIAIAAATTAITLKKRRP